jgi:hypothetical protein
VPDDGDVLTYQDPQVAGKSQAFKPSAGGSSPLLVASATLNNAQIKALPTTAIQIVAPTEVLDYEGFPVSVPVPVVAIISSNLWSTSYGNNDTNRWGLFYGSDRSAGPIITSILNSDFAQDGGKMFYILGAGGVTSADPLEGMYQPLYGSLLDNGLYLGVISFIGDMTGGDPANTMKVTVLYYVYTL